MTTLQKHLSGQCHPCVAFAIRPSGCYKGDTCTHCHFCTAEEAKERRRRIQVEAKERKKQAPGKFCRVHDWTIRETMNLALRLAMFGLLCLTMCKFCQILLYNTLLVESVVATGKHDADGASMGAQEREVNSSGSSPTGLLRPSVMFLLMVEIESFSR